MKLKFNYLTIYQIKKDGGGGSGKKTLGTRLREPWDFLSKNIGILGYFAAHIGIFKKFHLATLVNA